MTRYRICTITGDFYCDNCDVSCQCICECISVDYGLGVWE